MSKEIELDQAEVQLKELESQYANANDEQKPELEQKIASKQEQIETLKIEVSIEKSVKEQEITPDQEQKVDEPFIVNEEETISFTTDPTKEVTSSIDIGEEMSDYQQVETTQHAETEVLPPIEESVEPPMIPSSYLSIDELDNPIEVSCEVPNPNYIECDQPSTVDTVAQDFSMDDFLNENGIKLATEPEVPAPPPPAPELPQP